MTTSLLPNCCCYGISVNQNGATAVLLNASHLVLFPFPTREAGAIVDVYSCCFYKSTVNSDFICQALKDKTVCDHGRKGGRYVNS